MKKKRDTGKLIEELERMFCKELITWTQKNKLDSHEHLSCAMVVLGRMAWRMVLKFYEPEEQENVMEYFKDSLDELRKDFDE